MVGKLFSDAKIGPAAGSIGFAPSFPIAFASPTPEIGYHSVFFRFPEYGKILSGGGSRYADTVSPDHRPGGRRALRLVGIGGGVLIVPGLILITGFFLVQATGTSLAAIKSCVREPGETRPQVSDPLEKTRCMENEIDSFFLRDEPAILAFDRLP